MKPFATIEDREDDGHGLIIGGECVFEGANRFGIMVDQVNRINKAHRARVRKELRDFQTRLIELCERGKFGPQGYEQIAIAESIRSFDIDAFMDMEEK